MVCLLFVLRIVKCCSLPTKILRKFDSLGVVDFMPYMYMYIYLS